MCTYKRCAVHWHCCRLPMFVCFICQVRTHANPKIIIKKNLFPMVCLLFLFIVFFLFLCKERCRLSPLMLICIQIITRVDWCEIALTGIFVSFYRFSVRIKGQPNAKHQLCARSVFNVHDMHSINTISILKCVHFSQFHCL